MARSVQLPAPGRGAYDRSLSRAERHAQQRERLLVAAAQVLAQGELTVARIVERAGVGRSTFYEFFDSPEHLLEHLQQRVLRNLDVALDAATTNARTPLERLRGIVRGWLNEIEARPFEARVALTHQVGAELLSPAGKLLHRALERTGRAARSDGVGWFNAADEACLLAAAAAVEAVSRRHLSGSRLADAPRTLTDLITKLLR
jgi:AcrR family transcriptional regulator